MTSMDTTTQSDEQSSDSPRITKRKLEEVMSMLDNSLHQSLNVLHPVKRQRGQPGPPTSTPRLESLLPPKPQPPLRIAPPATYVPLSLPALISRISTYRLSTYSMPKPTSLSPAALSLYGWQNQGPGRERVQCVTCAKGVVLSPPTTGGWTGPAGLRLQQEYEKLVGTEGKGHDLTCPWRMRGCSRSLYRVQVGGRKKVIEQVRSGASALNAHVTSMRITSPARDFSEEEQRAVIKVLQAGNESELNDRALLLSLFGWTIPQSPASATVSTLSCTLCSRQVLLAPFRADVPDAGKSFELVTQHQSFCPFVDPHAGLSISAPPTSTGSRAGWRVRVDAILQTDAHGLGRRHSNESLLSLIHGPAEVQAEGHPIVQKKKGGLAQSRELLSYVRSLLGPKGGK